MTKIKANVMWANLNHLNEMSGKYQVDFCNLSKGAVDALAKEGIRVLEGSKPGEDKGSYITCKSIYPIPSYYEDGSEVAPTTKVSNGSEVEVTINPYTWDFKGKSGVSASIVKLVFTKLVEFKHEDDGSKAI